MAKSKQDTPRSDTTTPRSTASRNELPELVKLLVQSVKKFSPAVMMFLNLLQKESRFGLSSTGSFDKLDVNEELLLMSSNYISTLIGGSNQQSINDRLTGLARLELLCEESRAEGKLVLEIPSEAYTDFVDLSALSADPRLLDKLPILQGKILSSEKNKKTSGDDSGFPVKKLVDFQRDQIYYMHLNAACLSTRQPLSDYRDLNTVNRDSYQGAFKTLIQKVFSFSKEAELMPDDSNGHLKSDRFLSKAGGQDNRAQPSSCDVPQFTNLPLYTALAINRYLFSLISLDTVLITSILSLTSTLEILVSKIIPELSVVDNTDGVADLSEIKEFIEQVNAWWKESPYRTGGINAPGASNTAEFLKKYSPSCLSEEVDRPVKSLNDIMFLVNTIRSLHPPDDGHPSKVTPIHAFSLKLHHLCRRMLIQIQTIVPFMGAVAEQEVCTDPNSFLDVYSKFRHLYCKVYSIDLSADKRSSNKAKTNTSPPEASPQQVEVGLEDRVALKGSQSPPASRRQQPSTMHQRSQVSSAQASPRTDLTSSAGTGSKSPRPAPQLSETSSRKSGSRSGSLGEAPPNVTGRTNGLVRTESGKITQVEVVPNSIPGSNASSTKVSPGVSPGSSTNGSPRGIEGVKKNGSGFFAGSEAIYTAPDVSDPAKAGMGRGNKSLRRRSILRGAAAAEKTPTAQTVFSDTSQFGN